MNRERRSPPTSPNIAHASLRVPDLFVGEPGLDRVKSCHCGSSRNRLAGFRETGRRGQLFPNGSAAALLVIWGFRDSNRTATRTPAANFPSP